VFRGLLAAVLVALALTLTGYTLALAADPTPAATVGASPVLVDPLDPRAGQGASRTGAPFPALVFVVGLGAVVVLGTFAFVRVARR